MKSKLIFIALISLYYSCSERVKKEKETDNRDESKNLKEPINDSTPSNWDIYQTFPEFVKKTNVPDSLNFDLDNVFYGDFNGDNKRDFASPVINLENGFYGLIIIHNDPKPKYLLFGAGKEINGQINLDWIDKFEIISKGQDIAPTLVDERTGDIIGPDQSKIFKLIGDGISMRVDESDGGGILFWNGKNYEWYHIE